MNILILDDDMIRFPVLQEFALGNYGPSQIDCLTFPPESLEGYDVLFLDHDLGPDLDTHRSLRDLNPEDFTGDVIIHSMNPVGARNISYMFPNAYTRIVPYSAIRQGL